MNTYGWNLKNLLTIITLIFKPLNVKIKIHYKIIFLSILNNFGMHWISLPGSVESGGGSTPSISYGTFPRRGSPSSTERRTDDFSSAATSAMALSLAAGASTAVTLISALPDFFSSRQMLRIRLSGGSSRKSKWSRFSFRLFSVMYLPKSWKKTLCIFLNDCDIITGVYRMSFKARFPRSWSF